ncbi:cell division protein FtsL [Roseateles sp. SL47]|jgi:cell division protein FtsL|uniref:cell division protein FtsL n=1 Tax=Roseateles sp. SL47 TaxID=2995138 RepID=UPI00226FC007|nr:cell division protein FtsL [Roseateles sp. SL47]WAC72995.1 cell division protein FtsL [Roseateles sp. SL47]
MTRLNLILMAAVLASGIYMVRSAYEARRLFTELDRSQTEARRLDADYQKLLADRQAQATNLRVEQVARERLKMRPITPAITFNPEAPAQGASAPRTAGASP